MNNAQWKALVATFAPQVTLSHTDNAVGYNDKYIPSSIDWFIARCTLFDTLRPARVTDVTRAVLAGTPQETARLLPDDESVNYGDYSAASMGKWPMYVHLLKAKYPASEASKDYLDIQYWFFYPFSAAMGGFVFPLASIHGDHEGDWELVVVRVRNWRDSAELDASNIVGVYYAAHTFEEGKWVMRQGEKPTSGVYGLVGGTHPRVFSAWHSHASYECSGLHWRSVPIPTEATVTVAALATSTLIPPVMVAGAALAANLNTLVANDYCANGMSWGPLGEDGLEIMYVDEDVYAKGDDQVTGSAWIAYGGRWGRNDGAPQSPPMQTRKWAGEATNGYGVALQELDSDSSWSSKTGALGIALGLLTVEHDGKSGPAPVLLAGRTAHSGSRFEIWQVTSAKKLEPLAGGGSDWGNSVSCSSAALGRFAGAWAIGVARSPGGAAPFQIDHLVKNVVTTLVPVDFSKDPTWNNVPCEGLTFGTWTDADGNYQDVVVTARGGTSGPYVLLYAAVDSGSTKALSQVATAGTSWKGQHCTAVALGQVIIGKSQIPVLGAGKSAGAASRFAIYRAGLGGLTPELEGGDEWDATRSCTAIAFGTLDEKLVVAVGANAASGMRFQIYEIVVSDEAALHAAKTGAGLPELSWKAMVSDGGSDWDERLGVSGIAFGVVGGAGVIAISTTNSSNVHASKVYTFQYVDGALVDVGTDGLNWGDDRDATCIAAATMHQAPMVAYGRNEGNNARVILKTWTD